MNIVYSSDENYVQHMAVSMLSLYKTNSSVTDLNVFIISNDITNESKAKVDQLAQEQERSVCWIDFAPYKKQLSLDMEWPISISSYARLFLAQMLPDSCERVIYLDCDTVVNDSLEALWNTDMNGCAVAGVKDLVTADFKKRIGLNVDDVYINAGVMLVDLKCWRNNAILSKFIDFINKRKGRVTHHDQGVVNGTLKGSIYVLSPRYNSMTPYYTNRYKNLLSFYNLKSYYSVDEIHEAVENSAIIHYTPEFVGRVWEIECKHPKAALYRKCLNETEWKSHLVHAKPLSIKMKIVYWMYHNIPLSIIRFIFGSKNRNK